MSAKLKMVNMLAIVILAFALKSVQGEYDVAKYCALVPTNTKFPSFDSCKVFYNCESSNKATRHECPGNEVFNKDKGSCVPESQGNCKFGVSNPCKGKNEEFATDLYNCRMWHWCVNGESAGKATCASGLYFNGKECVVGQCVNENINQNDDDDDVKTEVKDLCNIMKVGMFFGDFSSCDKWKRCLTDKPITIRSCHEQVKDYVFNVQLQGCVPYSPKVCERTGGVAPVKPETYCDNDKKRPDEQVCSSYYLCKDSKWTHVSCGKDKYFDVETKECTNRLLATPVKTCDRCEYSSNKWVNAVDGKCSKFLTCQDGKKVGEGSCGNNTYFNEQKQACITGATDISGYIENNKACICDWECEIQKCKDDSCKSGVCNAIVNNNDKQADCKLAICEDDDCKVACNGYTSEKDKINCNLKVCKDETCKDNYCKDLPNAKDKNYCNLQKCQNQSCQNQVCKDIEEIPEKVVCKIQACTDDKCKYEACDDFKPDDTKVLECKGKICDDFSAVADKVSCKLKYCKNDDCKKRACDIYTDCDDCKAKCYLTNRCKDTDEQCKIEKCDEALVNVSDKVKCKLDTCKNVEECKKNICTAIDNGDDNEQKVECKIQICKDTTCKNRVCKDTNVGNKAGEQTCRFGLCKDDDDCKTKACKDIYKLPEEETEQLSCICDKAESNNEEKVKCKFNNCTNQECKNNVCTDNDGVGGCPNPQNKNLLLT